MGGFRAEQFMQIFLFNNRLTASGNGIGAPPHLRSGIKHVGGGATPLNRRRVPFPKMRVSFDDGAAAVRLARQALELSVVDSGADDVSDRLRDQRLPSHFDRPGGVFVTLSEHPSGALRGCIGFPRAVYPLRVAIPRAAQAAATEDPRFPRVRPGELGQLTVEVSLLTEPELLPSPRDRGTADSLHVGIDGLIVEGFGLSGLLLPQVAPEQQWNGEQFLEETCHKAGLDGASWKSLEVRVYRFQAEIFGESAPRGAVVARSAAATKRAARSGHRP